MVNDSICCSLLGCNHLDKEEQHICSKGTCNINGVKGIGTKTRRGFLAAANSVPTPDAVLSPVAEGGKIQVVNNSNCCSLLGHNYLDKEEQCLCSKGTCNINGVCRFSSDTQQDVPEGKNNNINSSLLRIFAVLWAFAEKVIWDTTPMELAQLKQAKQEKQNVTAAGAMEQ